MTQQTKSWDVDDPLTTQIEALNEAANAALSGSSGTAEPDVSIVPAYAFWSDTTTRTYRQFGDTPSQGSRALWTLEGSPLSIIPIAVSASTYTVPDGESSGAPVRTWLECDTTANAITITLPDSANTSNVVVWIHLHEWDASEDVITVQRAGTDVIRVPTHAATVTSMELANKGDVLGLMTTGDGEWVVFHDRLAGVVGKATTATLNFWERFCRADASGGAFTVSLPDPANVKGERVTVIKEDSSGNAVTVDVDTGENINGATTHVLSAQYSTGTYWSDGSQYWIAA